MNWKPGDRALFVSVEGDAKPHLYGQECTLLYLDHTITKDGTYWEAQFVGEVGYANERCLRPIPDKYDGNEAGDWDECPWQPEKILITVTREDIA